MCFTLTSAYLPDVQFRYFTAAIAARPSAAWKSYLLSGALWFTIPFALATSLGLASRAAALPLSAQEASEGLVAPAVAIHFMGKQGGYLIALMVLLAVTSTTEDGSILRGATCLNVCRHSEPRAFGGFKTRQLRHLQDNVPTCSFLHYKYVTMCKTGTLVPLALRSLKSHEFLCLYLAC